MALGLVAAGAVSVALALETALPATAAAACLLLLAAAAWLLVIPTAPPPPTASDLVEPDATRLDLERRCRMLETFVDQAPTPLLVVKDGGKSVPFNRAARSLLGSDSALFDETGPLHAAIVKSGPDERTTVQVRMDERHRTLAVSVADITGIDQPLRLVVLTDIQPALQAAEAAALRQLLQVLSHEIMNTLTPLVSLAQSAAELLLEDNPQSTRLAHDAVAVIARRADGLQRFFDAYRQLSRLPEPRVRPTSISALLTDAAQLFEMRWAIAGVRLELTPPVPDIVLAIDPDLIMQALLNLLANAAEAASLDGRPGPEVKLWANSTGQGATIAVEDNGPGVLETAREHLFQPFFTTKLHGSGVGLSIARQAIVSQGGQLVFAAVGSGPGARFSILL